MEVLYGSLMDMLPGLDRQQAAAGNKNYRDKGGRDFQDEYFSFLTSDVYLSRLTGRLVVDIARCLSCYGITSFRVA